MPASETKRVKSKDGKKTLAVFYDDGTIRIDGIRISYPHLGKAWAKASAKNPNPKPVYSAVAMLPKDEYRGVKDALVEHNKELMKDAKIDFVKDDSKYLVDGDKSGKPEMAGHYLVRTREERKPFVKNEKNDNMTDEAAERDIQGGDYGSILIRPWAQNSPDYGKRLNCGITGFRKTATGERFGEGRIGEEEIGDRFSDVGPDEEGGGFASEEDEDTL